jgi:hypothetical protein
VSDGYRWETRGMHDYYIDPTGRIAGELDYYFSKEHYSATLCNAGGHVPLGTYVSLEDARRAVERAVADAARAADAVAQQFGPRSLGHE